jgi:protease-4
MKALNLSLLSRVLSQPWAIRRETLVAFTQALIGGEPMRADTTFNIPHWDDEKRQFVNAPYRTMPGYTALNLEGIIASERGTLPAVPENVNVLLIWGPLGRGWMEMDRWWLDAIETDEITAAIAATPEGSTVALWFRSPGGIVTGIPEAATEIRRLSKGRRILAFSDDLCASAAYWLASQCEQIIATPTADIGSIGVYLAFYDFVGYLEKNGIKLELFKAGDLKGIGLIGNPLDDAAREYLQAGVLDAYAQFTKAVTSMRKLDDSTMQGQTLRGKQALAANLVDSSQPSAAAFLAALARGKT